MTVQVDIRQALLTPWRKGRRLSDKVLMAFEQACRQDDVEIAARLLKIIEIMAERPAPEDDRRQNAELISMAYVKLGALHPDADQPGG